MTLRFLVPAVCIAAALVVPGPVSAQEVDTTAADTMAAETVATDTVATDTMTTDTAPTDTSEAPMPVDSVATDTSMATTADTLADSVATKSPVTLAKEQARATASSWLEHVDAGNFGESWDAAASNLQTAVPREDWIRRGTKARSALRELTSRALETTIYRDSVAQLPDARPVVTLEYRTEFEAQSAREALVVAKQDTVWKVAGYRVVPAPDSVRADTTVEK